MTQERFNSIIENSLLHLYCQIQPSCSVSQRNRILIRYLRKHADSCDPTIQQSISQLVKVSRKPNINLERTILQSINTY
ncbi:hypothetical protein ACPV5G_20805 [Photobacterium damselae]|uniref:hypothetical protein n=1 Tax=Photobacterium damselae TaxID=38293 RepID=UPI0040698496